jgi:uncharacterized protein YcgI (DUF1989 family)
VTGSPVRTIPARRGKAAAMKKGQVLKVINSHGEQVVDFWAFNAENLSEFMSMEHTRAHTLHFIPHVGDILRTNHRRPILTLVEDTSGGIHDTQIAACDRHRYQFLGCTDYHDNCEDNLHAGLAEIELTSQETPAPFNLFMNIPVDQAGNLSFQPPVCSPGGYVALRAEMDVIVAFSACPQDILPINGTACKPTEAHFTISEA